MTEARRNAAKAGNSFRRNRPPTNYADRRCVVKNEEKNLVLYEIILVKYTKANTKNFADR